MPTNDKGPTRDDWVSAGLRQLAIAGIESVKVERLAGTLGISKGPFYWRFSGREELLSAMLQQKDGVVKPILGKIGANLQAVLSEIEAAVEHDPVRIAQPLGEFHRADQG